MNGLDIRRYEMLVRVREFGTTHGDLFPRSTLGGQAFAAVGAAIDRLTEHAATQMSGRGSAREGAASKATAREALRELLDAIVRTARAMALDQPHIDNQFRPPRGGDQALLSTARAFLKDAKPLAKQFIAHAMPKDFLADLEQSIADFEVASRDHETGREVRIAARAAIDDAMESALSALRRLDAVVPNQLREDGTTLTMWERARHVEYRSPRAKAGEQPAPASTSSAAAS